MSARQIGVVIPVFNNAASLRELHRRLRKTLDERDAAATILYVDDCSTDGSVEVLSAIVQDDPYARVLRHATNAGQIAALRTGLEASSFAVTVLLDADLQDEPERIPLLLAALEDGADAVFAAKNNRYQSASRMLCSRLFRRTLWLLLPNLPRGAGSFAALNRNAVEHLLQFPLRLPSIPAMLACSTLRLAALDVPRRYRPQGVSAYSFSRRARLASAVLAGVVRYKFMETFAYADR